MMTDQVVMFCEMGLNLPVDTVDLLCVKHNNYTSTETPIASCYLVYFKDGTKALIIQKNTKDSGLITFMANEDMVLDEFEYKIPENLLL